MRLVRCSNFGLWAAVAVCGWGGQALAAETKTPSPNGVDTKLFSATVEKGIAFLTKSQAADGSFSANVRPGGPAVTAMVATGLLRSGRQPSDPAVAKALKFLETFVQPDGGIYAKNTPIKNYETCVCMLCFAEANAALKGDKYKKILDNADKFLKGEQWDKEKGTNEEDVNYGGVGYGNAKSRPDLSNTSYLLDALHAAGNGPDDEAVKRALVFVSRCQNLEGPNNATPNAVKGDEKDKGGFYYTPAAGGGSPAGKTDQGGLRSYASMTYAGLKSMIYAGVGPDDPRVKAATKWLQRNYTLESNPGMGRAGLYYYYNTFAKTLDAIGKNTFADVDGHEHDWRKELVEELAKRQKPDGSWANSNAEWMEGDTNLATGFALLALSYCKPVAK